MNEEHALKDFVAKHLALLTSAHLEKRDLKDAVHQFYFVQHYNEFSTPSNYDIMAVLLARLQTSVSEVELHKLIDSLPLFALTGEVQRAKLHDSIRAKTIKSVLTPQQLKDLRQVGAFEAVERYKGKEIADAKQRELKDLDQKIQNKREEYESLPSILDREEIAEPDFDPTVEEIKPWWERFYLTGNPFPRKDGLSDISPALWESVLIKTEPFKKTLSSLQRNPNYLFNSGFLLVGDYGYGKTTFIDYLSNYLIGRDILPIRIASAKAHSDAAGFNDSFLQKFRMELIAELSQMSISLPAEIPSLEIEDQIVALASRIVPGRRKGIVVFLDDYHKFRSHYPQIYEFLGTLQVLKDTLTRKQLCVGFIVSGTPAWHTELQKNSQMMGFLDNAPIVMPAVSHELICEVFNRRIAAYCFESTPRRIRPEFVQKLVSDLAGEQGIRGCIVRIVDELNNNNLAIVDSPLEVPPQTLAAIRATLEKDDVLKRSFNKLLFETKFSRFSKEQIARCLEVLVQISVQEGIPETDKQFLEHKFYFQKLHNCALIQKQKVARNNNCYWTLNYRLRAASETVFKENKLALSDYLLKIYAYKDYAVRRSDESTAQTAPLRELRSFFSRRDVRLERPVSENINTGFHLLEGLLLRDPAETSPNHITNAMQALDHLTSAICSLESSDGLFLRSGIRDTKLRWQLHPSAPESIVEALHRLDDYEQNKGTQKLAHAVRSMTHALEDIAQRIKAQVTETCLESRPLLLRPAFHTLEENLLFQDFNSLNHSAAREDHYTAVKKLTDYLEIRFRRFLYLGCQLVFGDNYFDHCPQSVQSYAAKNLEANATYVGVPNKFDGLTRSQFKSIFLDRNAIRDALINPVDVPWKDTDWHLFMNMFARENIKVAHQQIGAFSHAESDNYRVYAAFAEELLSRINKLLTHCIHNNIFILPTKNADADASDCLFRCSFKPVQFMPDEQPNKRVVTDWPKRFSSSSEQHLLDQKSVKKIATIITSKAAQSPHGLVFQDLLDIEYIEEHFGIRAHHFIFALAFLHHHSAALVTEPWFGSTIVIRPK